MNVKDTKDVIGIVIESKVELDLDKWIRKFYRTYETFMGAKETSEKTRYNIHSDMPDLDKMGNEIDDKRIVSIDVICHNTPSINLQINSDIPEKVNKNIKYVLLFSAKNSLDSRLECFKFKTYIENKTVTSIDESTVNVTFDTSYNKQYDEDGELKTQQKNGFRKILKWIRKDYMTPEDYKFNTPKREGNTLVFSIGEGKLLIEKKSDREYSIKYNIKGYTKYAKRLCNYVNKLN